MIKLINLLILLALSMSAYTAQWTGIFQGSYPLLTDRKYDSCEQFITAYNKAYQPAQYGNEPWNGNTLGKLTYSHTEFIASNPYYPARFRCYATTYSGSSTSFLFTADDSGENACKKGVVSTAYFERVPAVTVCLGTEYGNLAGCEANLQHVEVLKTKHLGKYGAYGKFATNGRQCNFSTDPKNSGGSDYTVPPRNICDNKSFCEVSSPNDCPNGYGSGTFNGKTYCVLKTPNSPNPPTSPPTDKPTETTPPNTSSPSDNTSSPPADNSSSSGGGATSSGGTSSNGGTTGDGTSNGGTSGTTGGGTSNGGTTSSSGTSGSTGDGNGKGNEGDGDGIFSALKGLIDWLKEPFSEPEPTPVPTKDIPAERQIKTDLYASNAECIPNKTLNLQLGGISYDFSFQPICDGLHMLSFLIMALAYIYGAIIITRA